MTEQKRDKNLKKKFRNFFQNFWGAFFEFSKF